jgi:hypothetical protein
VDIFFDISFLLRSVVIIVWEFKRFSEGEGTFLGDDKIVGGLVVGTFSICEIMYISLAE